MISGDNDSPTKLPALPAKLLAAVLAFGYFNNINCGYARKGQR